MLKFSNARTNMVDCQIHTSGIVMPELLHAFETVPREKFVPAKMKNVAYVDEDLAIGDGRFLLDPVTHARMIQAAEPSAQDVILDIGGVTGYSSAIFSNLVMTVVALEEKKKYLDHADKVWAELEACNVAGFKGKLVAGAPEHGPYDIIFMNGSVSEIPANLIEQLAPGGRLVTIIRKAGEVMGQVTLLQSLGEKGFSSYTLFEAGCPFLPGFEPKPVFSF